MVHGDQSLGSRGRSLAHGVCVTGAKGCNPYCRPADATPRSWDRSKALRFGARIRRKNRPTCEHRVVARLLALDLPAGAELVGALEDAWASGDAVMVVDQRLSAEARHDLIDIVRPHGVVGPHRWPLDWEQLPELRDGDALVVPSSGSTGAPKMVVHTRAGLQAHAVAVHERLDVDPARDRWLACLPLAHLGGLGVVVRSLVTGVGLDLMDGFDADAVSGAPGRLGSTLVSVVPTVLDRIDVGRFRHVVVGGAADDVARPANVVRTYGLTETGGGVVYDGRPIGDIEVEVDGSGMIRLRGSTLARGVRAPNGDITALVDGDGWMTTGDRGRWSGDRLVVDGRADDLIITGGENVWPGPVESALAAHPEVADVAVMGKVDPRWGQRVVAVVVARDPARPPTLEDLRDHCSQVLPRWAAPRELLLVPSIARTSLGKVQRDALMRSASVER